MQAVLRSCARDLRVSTTISRGPLLFTAEQTLSFCKQTAQAQTEPAEFRSRFSGQYQRIFNIAALRLPPSPNIVRRVNWIELLSDS